MTEETVQTHLCWRLLSDEEMSRAFDHEKGDGIQFALVDSDGKFQNSDGWTDDFISVAKRNCWAFRTQKPKDFYLKK